MSVSLRNITRRFGDRPGVDDISLDVAAGEFMALVGPSGAGKTTLLRIIGGLEGGYGGRLTIDGRDVTQLSARRRNIGFVFQNYALFRHMTVAANVAFGLKVRPWRQRLPRRQIAARVEELLALVQVAELARAMPDELSGGQRQRVALARALATEPPLLLLDEPFGALDPLVRKDIRGWLRGLHDRLGLTTIMVTHDREEALELADRLAVLRQGRLEQVGTPQVLEHAPVSAFVTRFLGEAVAFAGTLRDGVFLPDEAGLAPLQAPGAADGRGEALIRAHEIGLRAGGGPAVVAHERLHGPYRRVGLRLADRAIEVMLPAREPVPPPGSHCLLELAAARVFDALGQGVSPRSGQCDAQVA